MGERIEVVANRTFQVAAAFHEAGMMALRKTAFDIEAETKSNITENNAVDTGAYRASVYVKTDKGSGYSKARSEAEAAATTPGKHSGKPHEVEILPELAIEQDEVIVAIGVDYAELIENGTVYTEARPALIPAFNKYVEPLAEVMAHFINDKSEKI